MLILINRMLKKVIIVIVTFLLLFSNLTPSIAHAQDARPWYNQDPRQWYIKVFDSEASPESEIFGERYTYSQVQWVMYSLFFFPLNLDGNEERQTCLFTHDVRTCLDAFPINFGFDPTTNENRPVFATLFPESRNMSGVNYVRERLANLNVIPEAQAQDQGFGFGALTPIQQIWRLVRNVMYALFVIIIIVLSFMIMFRYRISPQASVTIQSALPRVIISLLLVTFSYAIAGFMIDLTYVVIGLVSLVFTGSGIYESGWNQLFIWLTDGPSIGGTSMGAIGMLWISFKIIIVAITGAIFSLSGLASSALTAVLSGTLLSIIGVLLVAGFLIWALLAALKIMILLFKTYISIILLVIFAPIEIGLGAIPGMQGVGFGSWLKKLITNLMVYPLVGGMFLLSFVFLSSTYDQIPEFLNLSAGIDINSPFTPNLAGGAWYPPLTVGVQTQGVPYEPLPLLFLMIGVSILTLVPKAGELLKSIGSQRGFEGGATIGAAVGLIGGPAVGAALTPYRSYEYRREIGREARLKSAIAKLQEKAEPVKRS